MSSWVKATAADAFGRVLDGIEPVVGPVSWLLNEPGAVTLTMRRGDAKFVEDHFRLGGGMVLLEFDNGLPDWAGFVLRRNWRPGGLVDVEYRSAESGFEWRVSGKNEVFAASPGVIAETLLGTANLNFPTGIVPVDVYKGGGSLTKTYHYEELGKAIRDLQEGSGFDWWVEAEVVQGKVKLSFNFNARRGEDKGNLALIEGVNFHGVEFTEQDPGLRNRWYVVGGGSTWDDDRPVGVAEDATSVEVNGLREGVLVVNGVLEVQSLKNIAQAQLNRHLRPFRVLAGEAENRSPALYAGYDVGDRVRVIAPSAGFGGVDELGRVISREFLPDTGRCRVVLELDTDVE